MRRKILSVLLIQILFISLCFVPAMADNSIGVYLTADSGTTLSRISFADVQPTAINQRVLIPVRGLFENLGFSVEWNQSSSTAIVKSDTRTVEIPLNASYITVNNKKITTDVPAQVINSRTLIPVRAVSEALGLKVEWKPGINGVVIHKDYTAYKNYGSAGLIDGKTVIVSIFASEAHTSWDFSKKADNDLASEIKSNLGIATKWLSKNIRNYNANVEFIYDWAVNEDLVYAVKFHEPLVTSTGNYYYNQTEYIFKYINGSELLRKYNAQNIIYMFFFNTPYSNQHNSWSVHKSANDNFRTEIINIFNKYDDQFISSPSVYAHEIMHCFGAKDLYYENESIPQAYVDHCNSIKSNDIMYTVDSGKEITCVFSQLDAYYMGLTNSCSEVDKWNLKPSDYEILK